MRRPPGLVSPWVVNVTAEGHRLRLDSRVSEGPDRFDFETADGVVSAAEFRPPELLLADHLWEEPLGRVLCPQANYGVVGTLLAARADAVTMTEASARAAHLCRANAVTNGVENDVSVSLTVGPGSLDGRFETVAYAPKPYTPLDVGAQHVANALEVLHPGGVISLAASKRTGLARYEAALEECCGDVERLATTDGWHLLRATRPESVAPPAYVTYRILRPTIGGVDLTLVSVPGVFAATGLDDGTRLLLESIGSTLPDDGRVLDLCCGYGAIGVFAAKATDADVWLSDDCRFATRCAERGLVKTGVDGVVVTADCLQGVSDQQFDVVCCNPPTHAGDGILWTLFSGVADVLAPGGRFAFVHHRALDLCEFLDPFANVERVATGAEHVVMEATV